MSASHQAAVLVVLTTLILPACGQDSLMRKIKVKGYLKGLYTTDLSPKPRNAETGILVHNRLMFRYQPSSTLTFNLEMRNRIFLGESVRAHPALFRDLSYPGEWIDIRSRWMDRGSIIAYSNIDRLWVDHRKGSWHMRLGRQRINWGIGTVWNPNDLFNTFNFLDVDYEERPASDAVLAGRTLGETSSVEVAVAMTRSKKLIGATRYYLNVRETDLYAIAGWYMDQPTIGLGWSGYLKSFGWKGEAQYFTPFNHASARFNLELELDRIFRKNWYGGAGLMFNQTGTTGTLGAMNLRMMEITPRNLMPTRWNTFVFLSKEFSPLVSANVSVIWSPGTDLILLLPALKVNIGTEADLDFIGQSFFARNGSGVRALGHRMIVRIKWSF